MKKNIIFIGIILLLLGCFQTLGAEPAYPAWYSGFGLKAQVPLVYPFYIKLNDLTNVSVASPTDNYVLTYDAATKLWGAEVTADTDAFTVKIDAGATAGYLGVAYSDGVLRVDQNELTYVDGGDFITLGLADHDTARTALGLAIGTDVQAYDADLTTYAGITPSANAQTLLAETFAQMLASIGGQASDASLTSIAGLTYVSGSFIALTAEDTYTVRTYAQTLSDIGGQASDADLTTLAGSTAWRLFYSDGSNVITELALGTSGQYLKANGTTSAPTWDTPGGSDTFAGFQIDGVSQTAVAPTFDFDGTAFSIVENPDNDFDINIVAATDEIAGKVELATTAETTTGTDATRAVTPDGLKDGYQGSANVTTLGTIGTGTWEGTAVDNAHVAGLNQNCLTTSDIQHADIYHTGFIGTNYYDNGNSGASITIDWNNGNLQYVTLTAVGVDITFTEPPHPGKCELWIIQDGTGSRTIDWEHEISPKWPGGVEPTLTTTAAAVDVICFTYIGGTTYRGLYNGDFK